MIHVGQAHLQHYTEPSAEPLPATSSTLQATILPLGPGTFTHNAAGVPIIAVCTKADLIDDTNDLVGAGSSGMGGMVKGKGDEWEERTDAIMQILRTVCLKCTCPDNCWYNFVLSTRPLIDGASLFYTTPQPTTLNVLRQYALHALFVPPAPAPDGALDGSAASARNPFPFLHKPNTLDRDRIVVPAGWDSWGKTAVLRDGFDAKAWGEAWELDLFSESDVDEGSGTGARKQYATLVPDQGPKARIITYRFSTSYSGTDADCHSRPRSRRSTIQRRNKPSSLRITTRTRVVPTATRAAFSVALWTPLRRPPRVSWGH